MHRIELTKNFLPNNLQHSIATGILSRTVDKPIEILNSQYKIIEIPEKPVIGNSACRAKLYIPTA